MFFSNPVSVEKIAVNHYYTKSLEEFKTKKMERGRADVLSKLYSEDDFKQYDRNEEFDDGILKYRAARAENFSLKNEAERLNRVIEALTEILSAHVSGEVFSIETTLTCRALSTYLRENFPNDSAYWKICEEASLNAILKSLGGMSFADSRLLIRELPNLLSLPYPAVKELRNACLQIIPQLMNVMRPNFMWKDYVELDYLQNLLKLKEV